MAALWGRMLGRGAGKNEDYDEGIRLFDQGLYEQAIASFRQALNAPNCGPLTERLARFYLAEAHCAFALACMAQSGSTVPTDDKVVDNLRAAIALSPNYADLHYHLGTALLSRAEYAEALLPLQRALAINPEYARATLAVGIAYYGLAQYDDAFARAEEALTLDPTFRRSSLHEARVAHRSSEPSRALAALRRIGDSEREDDSAFHARLALDLYRRGMYPEAADEYRQALAINPNYADLRNQMGMTLYAMHRDTEATVEFLRALEINPRYIEARLNLGLAYARLGRGEDARTAFQAVLDADLSNAAALTALAALEDRLSEM